MSPTKKNSVKRGSDEWVKIAKQEVVRLDRLQVILDTIYIEDCHVSGMHDPRHTPYQVCEIQLANLARRLLAASHGVKLDQHGYFLNRREVNKIPRRINRRGWYDYYLKNPKANRKDAKELERWEAKGVVAK